MHKFSLTKYELKRRLEWISYGYSVILFSIAFIAIILYNEPDYLSWWFFVIIPLIIALFMFIFHQDLIIPLWSKSAYPEIEKLKKEKVTQEYYRLQVKKLLLGLVGISLILLIAYIIYKLRD